MKWKKLSRLVDYKLRHILLFEKWMKTMRRHRGQKYKKIVSLYENVFMVHEYFFGIKIAILLYVLEMLKV